MEIVAKIFPLYSKNYAHKDNGKEKSREGILQKKLLCFFNCMLKIIDLSRNFDSPKLVSLLYVHLNIIKIDENPTYGGDVFIWLQNQQIYMP